VGLTYAVQHTGINDSFYHVILEVIKVRSLRLLSKNFDFHDQLLSKPRRDLLVQKKNNWMFLSSVFSRLLPASPLNFLVRQMASKKHKKMIKLAKGYRGRANRCFTVALQRVQKAMQYSYIGRKVFHELNFTGVSLIHFTGFA